jgi:hypothetical protein
LPAHAIACQNTRQFRGSRLNRTCQVCHHVPSKNSPFGGNCGGSGKAIPPAGYWHAVRHQDQESRSGRA